MKTLPNIVPRGRGELVMLIVGKTPACVSVKEGHYFRGTHGKRFWKLLGAHTAFKRGAAAFEDESLLQYGFGITDIVKKPREFGKEPTKEEYCEGIKGVQNLILTYKPAILLFVYKRSLDKWMRWQFGHSAKATYGFDRPAEREFNRAVFAAPLPGVGRCTSDRIESCWRQLGRRLATAPLPCRRNSND